MERMVDTAVPGPWDELARLQARVEELERYAAVAAHELLTPVVMIDAYAATVQERLDDGRHADSVSELDALRAAATRSRLLAETLLNHARYGERPLRHRSLDLGAVLHECLRLLGPEIRARRAEVRVGPLPRVRAEESLIGAVFANLIGNALKFGPRAGATISVDARREPGAHRFIVTGRGRVIPYEDRERIFEPYERGRAERRARGGGLGLAICRQIVDWHGGEIGVEDTDGPSTAFSFTLPE
ncbi:MAG TPA: ATP-binding protein [Solirubrobacteraceae bacterium]|nr:ATP-binding protein [Solirubrobacteraceae bacterium]